MTAPLRHLQDVLYATIVYDQDRILASIKEIYAISLWKKFFSTMLMN